MTKSNAERQAAYRKRHAGEYERLNTTISASAKRALEQLAEQDRITQREVLERMLLERQQQVLFDVRQPPVTSPEQQDTTVEPDQGACGGKEVLLERKQDSVPPPRIIKVETRKKRTVVVSETMGPKPSLVVGRTSPPVDTPSSSALEPSPFGVTPSSFVETQIDFPRRFCPYSGKWVLDFGF